MLFTNYLSQPGEHLLNIDGIVGNLELILTIPDMVINHSYLALLGHPHSLQGGTMNNKVVSTLARTFKELGIVSIRFNFRSVGKSAGVYDAGQGESADMLFLRDLWLQEYPLSSFIFAGFSFGSYVAYKAAAVTTDSWLITIAPPVSRFNYQELNFPAARWLVVQGTVDEVVPLNIVENFVALFGLKMVLFPETGHFFHGKLVKLKEEITNYVEKILK